MSDIGQVLACCCGPFIFVWLFWILFMMGAFIDRKQEDNIHACPQCGSPCICDLRDYRCWCNKCTHWNEVQE